MNSNNKKLLFVSALFAVLFSIVISYIFLSSLKTQKTLPTQTGKTQSTNSRNALMVPGKTTQEELTKLKGTPSSQKDFGDKKLFEYPAGTSYAFIHGVLSYYLESVGNESFGKYSKTKGEGAAFNGSQDFEVSLWHIYPLQGVGVATIGDGIVKKLFFVPQAENSFVNTVAKDLGLVKIENNDTREIFNFEP